MKKQTQWDSQNEEREEYILKQKSRTKIPENEVNKMELSSVPDKEINVVVIKMITELRKRMD